MDRAHDGRFVRLRIRKRGDLRGALAAVALDPALHRLLDREEPHVYHVVPGQAAFRGEERVIGAVEEHDRDGPPVAAWRNVLGRDQRGRNASRSGDDVACGAGQVVHEESAVGDPDGVDPAAVDPRIRGQLVNQVRYQTKVVDLLHHRVRAAHQALGIPVAESGGGVGDDDPGLVGDVVEAADVPQLGGFAECPMERQDERQAPIGGPAGWYVQVVGALEPAGQDRPGEVAGAGNRIRSRVRRTAGSGFACQQNRDGNGDEELGEAQGSARQDGVVGARRHRCGNGRSAPQGLSGRGLCASRSAT